ncbi:hypothetical protein GF336_02305 [Candidatus Woesearchaeota archaeon]|nr:hypothetical protein [Candidatus Woesearchaeota archaeon]
MTDAIKRFRRYSMDNLPKKDLVWLARTHFSKKADSDVTDDNLVELLKDKRTLKQIAYGEKALNAVLGDEESSKEISPYLMFSILYNKVVERFGFRIDESSWFGENTYSLLVGSEEEKENNLLKKEGFKDYLINVLISYSNKGFKQKYFIDMLKEKQRGHAFEKFQKDIEIGNYALFMVSQFSKHIEYRNKYKKRVGIEYYGDMGKAGFESASRAVFPKDDDKNMFRKLSRSFDTAVQSLKTMKEKYFRETPNSLILGEN